MNKESNNNDAVELTPAQRYFEDKRNIRVAIEVLESIEDLSSPDISPTIYKLRGILIGMMKAEVAFDL